MKILSVILFILIFIAGTFFSFKTRKTIYGSLSIMELKNCLNGNKAIFVLGLIFFVLGIYISYQEYVDLRTFDPLDFLNFFTPLLYFSALSIFIIKKYIKDKKDEAK